MESYIDIHSHFLPGIDDGAKSLKITTKMLRIAQAEKIKKIILTPHNKPGHHNASPEKIKQLTIRLEKQIIREGLDIQLYTGGEIYYRDGIVELFENNEVCTMADTVYVLIEFGPVDPYEYIRNGIHNILSGGYQPIIAHVERYEAVFKNAERVEELVHMGAYIQINAGSVMGQYGFDAKQFTRRLLTQRLVHFVATDAHNEKKRAPRLKKCAKYISRRYGKKYARQIFVENPEAVLAGEYL